MDLVVFLFALVFLIPAAAIDFKTREVPDLISYGLIVFGIAFPLAQAIILWDWHPAAQMAFGLVMGLVIGLAMFYTGQWGGADAKLLIGMGALLGLGFGSWDAPLFLVLTLFAGALYGLLYSAWLAYRHWRRFSSTTREVLLGLAKARKVVLILSSLALLGFFVTMSRSPALAAAFLVVTVSLYSLFYLWVGIKALEQAVLIKEYPVSKLTEGDWIYRDVLIKGKRVCGPKDYGITLEQIAALRRGKVQKVWVKEGIPFVPSFLLGLLLLWLLSPSVVSLARLVMGAG
jgi:Flp pilus assembly protein protease CpaA